MEKKGKRKEDISSTKTDLSVCVSYKSIVVVLFFATNIFSAHRKKKAKKKNVLYKMNKKSKENLLSQEQKKNTRDKLKGISITYISLIFFLKKRKCTYDLILFDALIKV